MSALAAMARRVVDDPLAPVRDREHALNVLHRLQQGLPISARDHLRLRLSHGRCRRQALARADHWSGRGR